jgi:hypothetical protein
MLLSSSVARTSCCYCGKETANLAKAAQAAVRMWSCKTIIFFVCGATMCALADAYVSRLDIFQTVLLRPTVASCNCTGGTQLRQFVEASTSGLRQEMIPLYAAQQVYYLR